MTDDAGAAPPTPETDEKDWTWVLHSPCPDCGFDARTVPGPQIAGLVMATADRWREALAGPDVHRRPAPTVWSTLECGSHCRDVCEIFDQRLNLLLEQDDPTFPYWDQDATAVEKRYWEGDPIVVADELAQAAGVVADAFAAVGDDQWSGTGRRSNGAMFTVESLGRYFVHDIVHHLHDVGAPLGG